MQVNLHLSRVIRESTFCNCGYCEADQHLCFLHGSNLVGGSGTGDSFKLTLFFGSGGGSNLVGGSGTGDSFKLTLFFGSGVEAIW